jgi:DnaJ-domain-containing protein 1
MSTLLGRIYHLLRAKVSEASSAWSHAEHYDNGGTPPAESQPHVDSRLAGYYANLEVPYGSDLGIVRAAWKRQMKKYHPDLHAADAEKRRIANELAAELTTAYRELEHSLKQKEEGNVDV